MRQLLAYDPLTGIFTWRKRPEDKAFSARYAGQVAGCVDRLGYWQIKLDDRRYLAHRFAFLYMTGVLPQDQVDHINGRRADNRWENLQPATNGQNQHNSGRRADNSSGYRGVSWHARSRTWQARISIDGKRVWLGHFDIKEEAAAVYAITAVMFHNRFMRPPDAPIPFTVTPDYLIGVLTKLGYRPAGGQPDYVAKDE